MHLNQLRRDNTLWDDRSSKHAKKLRVDDTARTSVYISVAVMYSNSSRLDLPLSCESHFIPRTDDTAWTDNIFSTRSKLMSTKPHLTIESTTGTSINLILWSDSSNSSAFCKLSGHMDSLTVTTFNTVESTLEIVKKFIDVRRTKTSNGRRWNLSMFAGGVNDFLTVSWKVSEEITITLMSIA